MTGSQPSAELVVLGPRNRRVGELRRLIRKRSPADAEVVLEGFILISEALALGLKPRQVTVPMSERRLPAVVDVLDRLDSGTEVLTVTDAAFKSLATTVSPQPMLAVVKRPMAALPEVLDPDDLVIMLVGVKYPGNTGTIVRVASACSARCVVVAGGADPWATKAVRASSGAAMRVPLVSVTDPVEALKSLRDAGAVVVGTDVRDGVPYDGGVLSADRMVIVLGSEGNGLDRELFESVVDHWVRIPMAAPTESLNVAMAATLLAYETRRGRTPDTEHSAHSA